MAGLKPRPLMGANREHLKLIELANIHRSSTKEQIKFTNITRRLSSAVEDDRIWSKSLRAQRTYMRALEVCKDEEIKETIPLLEGNQDDKVLGKSGKVELLEEKEMLEVDPYAERGEIDCRRVLQRGLRVVHADVRARKMNFVEWGIEKAAS